MAKFVKCEALVLRRFRQGETSLIVHAFTRDMGRVHFLSKGARSGGKRPPVPLVPIILLEFVWTPSIKNELQLLREVSLVDGFGSIHENFAFLAWAQAGIETLSRTMTGQQAHDDLFDQTLDYLNALNHFPRRPLNHFLRFRLDVLRELGFEINLESLPPSTMYFYIPDEGVFSTRKPTNTSFREVTPGLVQTMLALSRDSREDLDRLILTGPPAKEIVQLIDSAYYNAFDNWRPLKSLDLLKTFLK